MGSGSSNLLLVFWNFAFYVFQGERDFFIGKKIIFYKTWPKVIGVGELESVVSFLKFFTSWLFFVKRYFFAKRMILHKVWPNGSVIEELKSVISFLQISYFLILMWINFLYTPLSFDIFAIWFTRVVCEKQYSFIFVNRY